MGAIVRRTRVAALIVVLALVAVACGGRLSEKQIQAELAADGTGAGGRSGTGTGGFDDEFDGGGLFEDGIGGGTDAASAAGGSSGRSGATSSGGSSGGRAPSAPAGGNGGATDVGITATRVTLGNVATHSGPVPGLFAGAFNGTQAYLAYQNSRGGLHGRQFVLKKGDDGFNAGQNRSAHKSMAKDVFGFVGSFSLFDGTGASEIEASGALDVGRALEPKRQSLDTHISPLPFGIGWPTTGCNFLKNKFGAEKVKKMAIFWGNADAARNNAAWQRQACEQVGFEFVYEREFQATESNFTADVQQMRAAEVEGIMIVFDASGIARFFKSIHQQNFNPPIKYPSPAAYDSSFIPAATAPAVEGVIIGQNLSMYLGEDQGRVPDIALFREWMQKVAPGQKIDIFALYGWASARLLIHAMEKAGPKVTRQNVLAELKGIHEWNNNGLSEVFDIGNKKPGVCEMYMEVRGGKFHRLHPAQGFDCNGRFHAYQG